MASTQNAYSNQIQIQLDGTDAKHNLFQRHSHRHWFLLQFEIVEKTTNLTLELFENLLTNRLCPTYRTKSILETITLSSSAQLISAHNICIAKEVPLPKNVFCGNAFNCVPAHTPTRDVQSLMNLRWNDSWSKLIRSRCDSLISPTIHTGGGRWKDVLVRSDGTARTSAGETKDRCCISNP